MSYTVNQYGSHPDNENDDCWTGEDFDKKEDALHSFHHGVFGTDVAYIEIDGPDLNKVRKNPTYKKPAKDDWRHEQAMEAGMLHGVEGWNDYMG